MIKYNLNDYIGKKIGFLTIIGIAKEKNKQYQQLLICKCECNKIVKRTINSLLVAKNPICGYCYNGKSYETLIGFRSVLLTIQNIYSNISKDDNKKRKYAYCKCDCGNYKDFPLKNIMNGNTKKCGECFNGKKYTDFIGESFGNWKVIDIFNKNKRNYANCQCLVCGNSKDISLTILTRVKTSCSICKANENITNYKSFIGKKFKNFTLLDIKNNKDGYIIECQCNDCNRIYKRYPRKISIEKLNAYPNCGKCYKGIKREDYIGKKYGIFTILDFKKYNEVLCICDCGNKFIRQANTFLNQKNTCGKCYNGKPFEYYIGKKSGYLTIEKITEANSVLAKPIVLCKCDCGNTINLSLKNFFSGLRTSCGKCIKGKLPEYYIGKTYGYFTIQNIIYPDKNNEKKGYLVSCTCKCNASKILIKQLSTLTDTKPILSCGCITHKMNYLKKIKFGELIILNYSNNNVGGLRYICKCDCGNEIEVLESDLFTGKITCCEECRE